MTTATEIIKSKLSDDKLNTINEYIIPELDAQNREYFGVYEPIFLEECYKKGDADEALLLEIALKNKYNSIEELLNAMDRRMLELADNY